jgi:hypothetical protein
VATTNRVRIIDQQEGIEILDENAKKYLGISGEEFLKRWDAGEYVGKADTPEVMRVASLIHAAR